MIWLMSQPISPSARRRRRSVEMIGAREATALCATLGAEVRAGRRRLKLTQARLAVRVGLSQPRVSDMERGKGSGAPIGSWIAVGIVIGRPLAVTLSRALPPEPRDAGHLAAQELILRLAKANRIHGTFELPARAAPSATYIDVGLRDDRHRVLSVIEIWNRFEEIGAGSRNFKRKLAEAEALAVVAGGDGEPYRVAGCWVIRATAANRALVARYPAIFAAEFRGSSRAWVRALTLGEAPPEEPGIVWVDVAGTRLSEVRFRA
jgi:transcriptional regulator with XRE-family HTH domain